MNRFDEIKRTADDAKLEQARQILVSAATFDPDETDAANERIEELVAFGLQFLPKDISPDGIGLGLLSPKTLKDCVLLSPKCTSFNTKNALGRRALRIGRSTSSGVE